MEGGGAATEGDESLPLADAELPFRLQNYDFPGDLPNVLASIFDYAAAGRGYFATARRISAAEMRKAALELAVWGIFCNFAAHRVAYSPNAPCRAHGYGWGDLREKATD